MRSWPQHWRSDRGIMERLSERGHGCPDPDSPWNEDSSEWVHGCSINPASGLGMCTPWQIEGVDASFIRGTNLSYAVTKDGGVYSYVRSRGPKHELGNGPELHYDLLPRRLKSRINGKGYYRVSLGKDEDRYVHRLVLTAFAGECPKGHEASHLNGDVSNNRLDNLAWESFSDNNKRKVVHGTDDNGEKSVLSKLTKADVIASRKLRKDGLQYREIMKVLGLKVTISTLSEAVIGDTWKSVNDTESPAPKVRAQVRGKLG